MNCKELEFYLEREYKKLEVVFKKIKYLGENKELWNLVLSYWRDLKYFYERRDKIKAFELVNYLWGMLDVLANLNLIYISKDIKKWFKVEQDE